MSLKKLKIKTYIFIALIAFLFLVYLFDLFDTRFFFEKTKTAFDEFLEFMRMVVFVGVLILPFHIVYVLQKMTQSSNLLKTLIFLFLTSLVFCLSIICVNPIFIILVAQGDAVLAFGIIVLLASVALLIHFALKFFKELVFITNEKMFLWCFYAFVGLIIVQVIAAFTLYLVYFFGSFKFVIVYAVLSLNFLAFFVFLVLLSLAVAKVKSLN